MNKSFYIFALMFTLSIASTDAHAGIDEFKDAIWKDCAAAQNEVPKFEVKDRISAIEFIKGIITLNLSNAEENPLINPGIIKAPEGIQSDVSFAQSLDPERSNRAKKCVADILPMLVPESALALPVLITQSEDLKINFEVRASFARVAYKLAQSLALPSNPQGPYSDPSGPQLSETLFDELFQLYLKSPSSLNEEILTLYPRQLISKISDKLIASDCQLDCNIETKLTLILSKLDLQNADSQSALIALIEQARPEIRLLILKSLQYSTLIYEPLLKTILPRLAAAQEVERAQLFQNLNIIFNYELRTASLAIDPKDRLGLLSLFDVSNSNERDVLERGLAIIAPLYSDFTTNLKPLIISKDPDLRARAARLLSRVIAPDKEVKLAIEKLLSDTSIEVQQVALENSMTGVDANILLKHAEEIELKIQKQLKLKQLSEQQSLDARLVLLRSVSQIPISTLPVIWNSIALSVIESGLLQKRSSGDLSPALSLLLASPKRTLSDLRTFARSRDASKRNAAVFIIQRGFVPDTSIFDTLLSLLSDSDSIVSKNAHLTLLMLTPNLKDLMATKRSLAPSPRLDELLFESGLRPNLSEDIQRRVVELDCSEISEFSGVCLSKTISGGFCAAIISQIPRCIDSGILGSLPTGTVEKAISLQPQIRDLFIKTLFDMQTTQSAQLEIGLYLLRARTGDEKVISRLCELANIASDSVLSEIISYATLDPLSVKNCLEILRRQFEDSKITSKQKALLFKYILKLDPKAINVPLMLKDALERQDLDFLRVMAGAELINDLLPVLAEILVESNTSSSEQDRLIALQLLEELGQKAANQFPVILPLLDSQSNDIRYHAARAIIASNVDRAASIRALRAIINSSKFSELTISPSISELSALVESLLNDNAAGLSALERRNLLRLLRVVLGPEAAIPQSLDDVVSVNNKQNTINN